MHRVSHLAAPLALALCTASAAPPVELRNAPAETRAPVAADPAVDPRARPSAKLPPAAFRPQRISEEAEEREGSWESAKWSQSTLRVRGSGTQRVAVAGPASVLIKAEWRSAADLRIDVRREGAAVARLTSKKTFDGSSNAVATVRVTEPGELTIDVSSAASQAIPVRLHVGVMPATH